MTAALLFLKTYWRYIAGALLLAAAWWWHSGQVHDALTQAKDEGRAEVQALWDAAKAAQVKADAAANEQHRQDERTDHARVTDAQNNRAQTAGQDAAALAGLRTERDRLRDSLRLALNTIRRCDVPGTAADAAADRTAAVESVLDSMAREAEELARAADSHAADSLMYQRAWPRR